MFLGPTINQRQQRNGLPSVRDESVPLQAEPRSVTVVGLDLTLPAKTGQSPPHVKHQLQATAVWLLTAIGTADATFPDREAAP